MRHQNSWENDPKSLSHETVALCSYKQETVGHMLWGWPEETGSEAWFGKNDAERGRARQER